MKKFQPPAAILVHQRERRRMHPRRHAESPRQSTHELRLARAEVAAQRNNEAALCRAAKFFAEAFRLRRAVGNEDGHGMEGTVGNPGAAQFSDGGSMMHGGFTRLQTKSSRLPAKAAAMPGSVLI